MKTLLKIAIILLSIFIFQHELSAQEQHGGTLNLGLGVGGHSGYSRYAGQILPVLNINYEFDVVRNFTLAPTISFYTYSNRYYWSNTNYTYRETVIPVGIKGTYYFDELFDAHSNWDFYAAASAGFAIVNSRWGAGYNGDKKHFHDGSPVFADLHAGAEYHFSDGAGVYLDLSSGISTIGIAFHPSR